MEDSKLESGNKKKPTSDWNIDFPELFFFYFLSGGSFLSQFFSLKAWILSTVAIGFWYQADGQARGQWLLGVKAAQGALLIQFPGWVVGGRCPPGHLRLGDAQIQSNSRC